MTPVPEDETSSSLRPHPKQEDEVRRRQRERAKLMAILLGLFAVLMFAITIAKMSINQ
ncbi:MAG TPA: hypothetical protein VM326_04735 [Sphingomicrobium sp.]|nr:hypothetical protein [Sphingomicrobium sp.]